jgi:inorganic pyrophosphatase
MEDEKGPPANIIAGGGRRPGLPARPPARRPSKHLLEEIELFFEIYKDLEPGKSSSTAGFEGLEAARMQIAEARAR